MVYAFLNAAAMLDSPRIDTGDLGPFGDHPQCLRLLETQRLGDGVAYVS